MMKLGRIFAEIVGAIGTGFAAAPPTVADDTLVWAFRGIVGIGFILILHQLREANKKLNTIAPIARKLLRLEQHLLAVARILSEGATKYGHRDTDPMILALRDDIEREIGGISHP